MNQWDKLSAYFDTHKKVGEIDPGAADNILIAWPAIQAGIRKIQKSGRKLDALDFGCGTGGFCKELQKDKYHVLGCDTSEGMLKIARASVNDGIVFKKWGAKELAERKSNAFDLISAIMVFQFIEDAERSLAWLDRTLRPNGVLAFAVFNPDYVRTNLGEGRLFNGFNTKINPTKGHMCATKDTKIPTFIRDARWYDGVLRGMNYKRILYRRPRFGKRFLALYPTGTNTKYSEYLILVYKKGANK